MNWKIIPVPALKLMLGIVLLVLVVVFSAFPVRGEENNDTISFRMLNPHLRVMKGPPLTSIFNKANEQWLFRWIKEPGLHDPTAKMPDLALSDEEVLAILSYLKSIAPGDFPTVEWSDYLFKAEEDLTDNEYDAVFELYERGKAIYRQARCSICHRAGKRGGVVALRVGISLKGISGKAKRDWLYNWLKNPSALFPDTFMPRFRLSDEDIRALVEYLMKDTDFTVKETKPEQVSLKADSDTVARGKRVIELSRCIICHDIEGIEEVLPLPKRMASAPVGIAKLLSEMKCLSCHKIRGQGGDYAPDLTYSGSKLQTKWIADFLQEPDLIRPLSQQMPKLFLNREEAQTVARYMEKNMVFEKELLAEVPKDLLKGDLPGLQTKMNEGRQLFRKKGCYSCHTLGGKGGALGPDLSMAPIRLKSAYVYLHLKDPGRFVPFTREPDFGLSKEEAISLTVFLMSQGT